MRLEIARFGGMAPLVDPTALSDQFAQLAKNVRFDRGVLSPAALRLVTTVDYPDVTLTGTGTTSVAKLFEDGTRFAFTQPAGSDAFPSPIAPVDTWGRVYFMSASGPSFTTSDQYVSSGLNISPVNYRLGVPAPVSPPSASVVIDSSSDPDSGEIDNVDVAYIYTHVDHYGHEGAPSPASAPKTLAYNRTFTVSITFPSTLPTRVNFTGNGVRRLYRATFDGTSSTWQFIADVPAVSTSYSDTLPLGDESEALISGEWYPAPDALTQLCLVSSAFAAGVLDHYLCYSVLKLPHAWPKTLQYPLKYAPVKLMPLRNGLLIATTGRPYWAEGSDPYSALPQELPINAPCISAESVVDMGDVAMFITEEGIVSVGGGQASLVSQGYIDRGGMLALVDETCTAFVFDRRYVFSTIDDRWMAFSSNEGFVEYDFGFPPSTFTSVTASARENSHYFAFTDGTVRVVDFEGVVSDVAWYSKHFRTPPVGFSVLRVEADTYPVAVRFRSQYLGELWNETDIVVNGPEIHRVPSWVATLWQVEVVPPQGGRVYRLVLAQSGRESA